MKSSELITKLMQEMSALDANQMVPFVQLMTSILISIMRGIHGDDFVKDYLTAAINDENPPKITPVLKQ